MIDTLTRSPQKLVEATTLEMPAQISAKGAAIATAQALKTNPSFGTSHLEGLREYKEGRDKPDSEAYVRHKAERFAISAAAIDIATNDLVTNPADARDARFIALPDMTDEDTAAELRKTGFGDYYPGSGMAARLKHDIDGAVYPVAFGFLEKHPDFKRAAERFEAISEQIKGKAFDEDMGTIELAVYNTSEALRNLVIDEYLPLTQRLLYGARGNPELHTPEQRLEAVKEGAHKILFSNAAINLGHLQHIGNSDGPWSDFSIGDNAEGSFERLPNGRWTITMVEGSERPAKPKQDLAGETINCPALLQLEERDSASPLHRLVYATINEAHTRGMFNDYELQKNYERLENIRIAGQVTKFQNAKPLAEDLWRQITPPPPHS